MKKIKLLILALSFASLANAVDYDTIKANNALIEYTGRIDFSNPLKPKFSYSGVSARASFQGTSISLILSDEGNQNNYNIILDNSIISRLVTKSGLNTYEIATGLKDTIHEIEIFRLTEQQFGKTQFYGYLVDKGKTLTEISNKRTHLIEFIGNSITCGYGNEGINGGVFGPTTENHYLTYAAITSRSFNVRHLAVCKSGIGIYRNYDGPVAGSPDCMSNFYQRIFLYDEAPLYNFSQKPDLICIDLGTNDFSTSKGDSAKYVSKYLQFIDTIQLKNNNADILCLLGPMLSGNDLTLIRRYLKFIVDSVNKKNNGKISFFEMSPQTGSLGIAIDYHPTVAQHLKNAKELINCIDTLKNWQIQPQAIIGTSSIANEVVLEFNTEIQDLTGNLSGFSVFADKNSVPISSASIDASDKTKIHLLLTSNFSVGQQIIVSYTEGSIESKKNIKLKSFSTLSIYNKLIETKLTKAVTDKTGSKITLTLNKNIDKASKIDGLLLLDKENKEIVIDSYSISSKSINLNLKDIISAGDTIFLSITSSIFGQDLISITPIEKFQVTNNSLGTSIKNSENEKLVIYPNPLRNRIVNFKVNEIKSGKLIFQLYNLQGKLLINKALTNYAGQINLNKFNVEAGSYVVKFSTSKRDYSKVVILN